MLYSEGTHFITATMHPPYHVNIPDITIPFTVDMGGCLTMTTRHIFIVGGYSGSCDDIHDHAQIYDMINGEWLDGVPSLPTNRSDVACYVTNDKCYAIGGMGGKNCDTRYDSILMLNVSAAALVDISSQEWQMTAATINTPSSGLCIVKHRNDLILVGGRYTNDASSNEVNILNTLTGDCYLAGTLSTAARSATCILPRSNNTLYLFGGYSSSWDMTTWQFINLLTLNPTANPSAHPISLPTQFPTSDPSVSPTTSPFRTPTASPHSASTPSDITFYETLASRRNTTEMTEYATTIKMVHDTIGSTEVILDRLAMILISICAILCFAVSILLCIAAVYKNKEKESLKQTTNISEAHAPNDGISAMDDDGLCEDKVTNKNEVVREIEESLKVTNEGEGDVVFDDVNKNENAKKIEYVFDNNNDAEVIQRTEGEG
eukprot:181289_1